jgi:hypothetical protein
MRLIRCSRGPQPRCLHFYPTTRSAREFIKLKRITHPYPFRFLLLCRSALQLPHTRRGRALPSFLPRALSATTRLRLVLGVPLAPPIARAGADGARSACRARRPPDRPKPDASGAGGSGAHAHRWCRMLVVLTCRYSPPAPTPMAVIDRHSRSPSPMLKIYISSISDVSEVYCSYFIWLLQK